MDNSVKQTHPVTVGLLTLPTTLEQHGFLPVPATMVAALGLSLYTWQILAAPFVDLSLSLRRWYLIGLALSISGVLPFFWLPLKSDISDLMKGLVGVSQFGALLMLLASTGCMARYISANKMGRASGWYQVGITGGQGVAIISILTLSSAFSWKIVFLAELLLMLTGIYAFYLLPVVRPEIKVPIRVAVAEVLFEGRSWIRSSKGIFTCLMALSPIGIGAATVGWNNGFQLYAIPENEMRLVIGPLSIVCSLAGFLVGGWASDRYGRWATWLRAGGLLALMSLLITFCPFIHWLFDAGLLCYAFLSGFCAAAFWAIIMQSVSPLFAVTKIALLSMLLGISFSYMRAFDGSVCDDFSFQVMLLGEALLSFLFIGIALLLRRKLRIQ